MKRAICMLLVVVFLATMASCLAIGTGGEKVNNQPPTLGQELMDLQKAKDSGAITVKEYEELKEHLKKNYDPTEN
jgi:hypothetical protein